VAGGRYVFGQKKIKGISAGLSLPGVSIKGFGALAAAIFTIQTITGKNGLQGPYMLTGNQESGFIMPIQGTVKVSIGGKKSSEGIDQDFTVDYDLGSVTFTPRILIRDEDIIKLEYEYRVFDLSNGPSRARRSARHRPIRRSRRSGACGMKPTIKTSPWT